MKKKNIAVGKLSNVVECFTHKNCDVIKPVGAKLGMSCSEGD